MSPCPEPLTPILTMSPWVFCNHTINLKTDSQHSVLQFTEIKIWSFYCQAQQRLKEIHMYESLTTVTRTAAEITQTGFLQKHPLINQSIFAS